jgi:hypothetical protein
MTTVSVTKTINVPASEAWAKISSFRGIEEFSPIARSVVEGAGAGAKRTCYMPDDAAIYEVLNKVDESSMEIEYEITSGPFPISGYVSTVTVNATDNNSCEITWGSQFEVDAATEEEMKNLFGGFYNVIIDSLETLIKSQN